MDNKRLTSNLILIFIMILMIGCCSAQPIVIIPKAVTPTTAHQIMIYDGSTFKLKELVGFTSSSTQMTIPSATDGSITNEGLLGVGAGTGTSSVLLTNTSTGTGVTINTNAPATITESTSSNGGSITIGVTEVDGSVTNEGQLSFSGSTNGTVSINTNTSGSSSIKVIGKSATTVTRGADTLYITTPLSTGDFKQPSVSTTVNNGTLTNLPNITIEIEEGGHVAFTTYLHYTTGATSQGVQFRITTGDPTQGTYWFDYDFPITGGHQTGSIYNANTTISTPSSESGTNIAIIRGIVKSNNTGILDLIFQVAAEDGSSTITVLTTSVTKLY